MGSVSSDIRYAMRTLRRSPLFSAGAVLTLALAIGSCTATFSIVSFALLHPISCDQPDQLVVLDEALLTLRGDLSPGPLLDWKDELTTFADLAAYSNYNGGANISGGEEPDRVQCVEVTASFFGVFGVNPALGRTFAADEQRSGSNRVAIISSGLWKRRFAASPDVPGRTISLNSIPFTIIGVAPAGFRPPSRADVWVPISLGTDRVLTSAVIDYEIIGRLKPQVTVGQARSDVEALKERFKRERSDTWLAKRDIKVIPLIEVITGNLRTSLLVLAGSVFLVMLIACANTANLLLSRAAMRQKEIALRAALGASRLQLIRQFLIESLVVSCAAGSLGLLTAYLLLKSLATFSASQAVITGVTLDTNALFFTLSISLFAGMLAGLAPAIHASKIDLNESLKRAGVVQILGASHMWGRLFVVSEIALALVLLSGTGLLVKSLIRLQKVESGLNQTNVLTVSIDLPRAKYTSPGAARILHEQLLNHLASIPGCLFAGAVNALPLSNTDAFGVLFEVIGQPTSGKFQDSFATNLVVTPDYFRAMGIPLLSGRTFSKLDNELSSKVLIVNQSFAERWWPDRAAIGKRVALAGEPVPYEIVGVVGDVKHFGLEGKPAQEMYRSYLQEGSALTSFVIRTEADPHQITSIVRAEVQRLDPDIPTYDVKTMDQRLDEALAQRRLILLVLGAFTLVAVALALGGTYVVMSYTTLQRTREIGIRMAVGADRGDIFRLVMRSGLMLASLGVALGAGCSIALTRLMSSLLFNLEASDPMTLGVTASSLALVAVLACILPTYRATKVDPVIALKCE